MTPSGHPVGEGRACPDSASGRRILVLTGSTRAGKTTICRWLAAAATTRGRRVAGVICPARFREGAKIGILATDLRSGDTRLLAVSQRASDPQALGYRFDEEALAWANGAIASAAPCDLLIVDELGPLEIEQGRGFVAAFDALREGGFRLAVVVVRPSLLEAFGSRLGLPFTTRNIDGVPFEEAESDGSALAWFEEYLGG